jgi:hypothetical protein
VAHAARPLRARRGSVPTPPGRAHTGAVASALVLALTLTLVPGALVAAGAQEPPRAEPAAQLAVADASIEGAGPWTSWFGAAPDRELVVTVVNIGTTPVEDPELVLHFGKGASPGGSVAAPTLGALAPGETTSVRVALDLPPFAVGTYAVEGSFPGLAIPVGFRAETSHIPWLVLLVPLAVLIQLGLVLVRNRVRDRIHRVPSTSDPTLPDPAPPAGAGRSVDTSADDDRTAHAPSPPEADLETVIREELDAVFDEAARRFDDSLDDAGFRAFLIGLAATVCDRTEARVDLADGERIALRSAMTAAVLDAFEGESVPV